jgi:hypothetical protein
MNQLTVILLPLLCCCAPALAIAARAPMWGSDGHEVTASIAQSLLSSNAASQVSSILSGQSLSQVSTWADAVKYTAPYEWSGVLHYINTPDWACNYQYSRDCPNAQCVSGALKNYTKRLVDSSLPADQINEALKFVTHFAGDIHQPLHVGFTSDEGGNSIKGTFEGDSDSLHYIWDVPLVQLRIKEFGGVQSQYTQYLLQQIQGPWASNASAWEKCSTGGTVCPDDWASESVLLACSHAYVDQNDNVIQNGFNLGDPYYQFNKGIVDEQLAKGGVRLANMLNALLTDSSFLPLTRGYLRHHLKLVQKAQQARSSFADNRESVSEALSEH